MNEIGGDVIELRDEKNKDAADVVEGKYKKKQRPKQKQEQKRISEVKGKEEQGKDVAAHEDKETHRGAISVRVISM